MSAVRILACLDVCAGRVVKGIEFKNLRDSGDPVELARNYDLQGSDEIVFLDIGATPEDRETTFDLISRTAYELEVPLTVGGGVRSAQDVGLLLRSGADKVALNSAAVRDPEVLTEAADAYGSQCVVCAIDAAPADSGWRVCINGGRKLTSIDVVEWAVEATKRGAGEILLTSMSRDGTKLGYETKLIEEVVSAVTVPVIASGGAGAAEHLIDAVGAGASAVLIASMLHEQTHTVGDLKMAMRSAGLEVRL